MKIKIDGGKSDNKINNSVELKDSCESASKGGQQLFFNQDISIVKYYHWMASKKREKNGQPWQNREQNSKSRK